MSYGLVRDFSEAPDPAKYSQSYNRISRVVDCIWGLNIMGMENLPQGGAYIFAPKHSSLLDPFFVGVIPDRAVYFMGKKEIWTKWRHRWIAHYLENRGAFPVDRDNYSRESIDFAQDLLKQGKVVGMFPEATSRNRGEKVGIIREGVGWLAIRAAQDGIDCPIVPVGITSEQPWKLRTIHSVIGKPFYPEIDNRPSKIIRKETTERLRDSLQTVYDQALELQKR